MRHVRGTSAPEGLVCGLVAATAILLGLFVAGGHVQSAQSSIGLLAVDTEVEGNSAADLGTVDSCREMPAQADKGTVPSSQGPVGGFTNAIADASKSWAPGKWTGFRLRFTSGALQGTTATVTGSAASTLNFDTLEGAPAAGDRYEVAPFIQVDVVLDSVPSGKAMALFQYDLAWDSSILKITEADDDLMLAATGDYVPQRFHIPSLDSLPFTSSPITSLVADFGELEAGPAKGVLMRYTLEPASIPPATGISPLIPLNVTIGDEQTIPKAFPIDAIAGANIAVGADCTSVLSGPAATATAEALASTPAPGGAGDGSGSGDGESELPSGGGAPGAEDDATASDDAAGEQAGSTGDGGGDGDGARPVLYALGAAAALALFVGGGYTLVRWRRRAG